jgi:HPC2 and ubinuclein domain
MDAGEGRSSSNDLSSAPNSDTEGPFPLSTTSTPLAGTTHLHNDDSTIVVLGGASNPVVADAGGSNRAAAPATLPPDARQEPPQPKATIRRRKKQDTQVGGGDKEKEKKDKPARKPRAAAGTAAARKKPKLEHAANKAPSTACNPQDTKVAKPHPLSTSLLNSAPEAALPEAAKLTQFGFTREAQMSDAPKPNPAINHEPRPVEVQPQFTPRSTSVYDPVRSITQSQRPAEPARAVVMPQVPPTPPRPINNASASPAISSIIDPPVPPAYATLPPMSDRLRADERQTEGASSHQGNGLGAAMELDPPATVEMAQAKPALLKKPPSDGPSSAPSPKPARVKEALPPLPQGSGLLSSTVFGGDAKNDGQASGEKGPNIILHVDLKGQSNRIINFARMAEEKYGFAALYPRQAAQKERLARIAAAGAALERSASSSKLGGSAGDSGDDDGSVDIDRDSDNDGDVMMSGVNGGLETGANSGTDGAAAPKRRRRRKIEEYDQEDPFVDDSELIWEAQAAASKDGFFVFLGPLVPEGEKPAVERYVPDRVQYSAMLTFFAGRMAQSNVGVAEGAAGGLALVVGVERLRLAPILRLEVGEEVGLAHVEGHRHASRGSQKPTGLCWRRRKRIERRWRLWQPNRRDIQVDTQWRNGLKWRRYSIHWDCISRKEQEQWFGGVLIRSIAVYGMVHDGRKGWAAAYRSVSPAITTQICQSQSSGLNRVD